MAQKKLTLFTCIVCDMHGTEDAFTVESNGTCKKCSRGRHLEKELELVIKRLSVMKLESDLEGRSSEQPQEENPVEEISAIENEVAEMTEPEPEIAAVAQEDAGVAAPEPQIAAVAQEDAGVAAAEPQKKAEYVGGRCLLSIVSMGDIDGEIDKAIECKKHFFIGICQVNVKGGSAASALRECELLTCDQNDVWSSSNHPVDKKAKDEKQLELVKLVSTKPLKTESASKTYDTSISKYSENSLCINANSVGKQLGDKKRCVWLGLYEHIPVEQPLV